MCVHIKAHSSGVLALPFDASLAAALPPMDVHVSLLRIRPCQLQFYVAHNVITDLRNASGFYGECCSIDDLLNVVNVLDQQLPFFGVRALEVLFKARDFSKSALKTIHSVRLDTL